MLKDLRSQGFHVCLWQLPYFTPKNRYFSELIEKDMYVKNGNGELPYEDVVLDFSNPETVKWYQDKLAGLLNIGVSAIKVDFGEAAPLNGIYASGKSGWYEHNLYPVRYDMAVSEITKKLHNENIMWARAHGPVPSVIHCIGAVMLQLRTRVCWVRFVQACPSACPVSPSGAMIWAAL